MKLFYRVCELEIELQQGSCVGICLENREVFRQFTETLWQQAAGADGELFLTSEGKPVKLNKEGCVIFNPYEIDVNERKILNHIYEEMREIMETTYYEESANINGACVSLLDEIEKRLPYSMEYSLDMDFTQLLKMYNVKVVSEEGDLLSRVVNYIRLSHQVLGTSIFMLVHGRDYFTPAELEQLKEMVAYEQVILLFVENRMDEERQQDERWWIVDDDACIIEA
jgi:CRISPR-associated protein Csn2